MKRTLAAAALCAVLLSPARAQEGAVQQAWRALSPQQQERILENRERFFATSPDHQWRIRERYARFKDLTLEQQAALIRRYEADHARAPAPAGKAEGAPPRDNRAEAASPGRDRAESREHRMNHEARGR